MVKLKLCRGLSYNGIVSATREYPFVETDNATAQKAVETGYFKVVQEAGGQTGGVQILTQMQESPAHMEEEKKKPISRMNKSELLDLALEQGLDVSAFKKIEEVRSFLKNFMESGSQEEESEPDFGEATEEV